ncbi:hypothetical protein NDU88_002609 [Pleurodeles waltl]|uniref:Uncharacterized protein n=1 Tax=Pleurodeles waltl TaxID=8319 RepID=A0AAV7KSL7_PLEWA|nr:hypothetical protein NDU88_002609 [Pleurodeles waltl]
MLDSIESGQTQKRREAEPSVGEQREPSRAEPCCWLPLVWSYGHLVLLGGMESCQLLSPGSLSPDLPTEPRTKLLLSSHLVIDPASPATAAAVGPSDRRSFCEARVRPASATNRHMPGALAANLAPAVTPPPRAPGGARCWKTTTRRCIQQGEERLGVLSHTGLPAYHLLPGPA